MKIKSTCLAFLLVLIVPAGVKAQSVQSIDSAESSCDSSDQLDTIKNSECYFFPVDQADQSLISQRTRKTRNSEEKNSQGYYGGVGGGVFLSPDPLGGSIDLGTGFGGSVFGGMKFPKNLGAEAELMFAFGGIDTTEDLSGLKVDGNYNTFGLFLNGRYDIPLSKDSEFKFFVSPGIGLIRASQSIDISDEEFAESAGVSSTVSSLDISTTTFGLQLKAGASIPFSEKMQGFAQGRYTTNGLSTISLEGGLSYDF